MWCYNDESGIRDIYSKPDLGRAIILQRLVDWSHDPGKLLETAGLKITEFGQLDKSEGMEVFKVETL